MSSQIRISLALALFVATCFTFLPKRGSPQPAKNKTVINIGALLYMGINDVYGYNRSVFLAKTLLENNIHFKHLTDNYTLEINPSNSRERSKLIYDAVAISTSVKPKPLAFIGPGYSRLLDYAAATLEKFETPLVPFPSFVPEDVQSFKYTISASPGIKQEISARMAFFNKFKWSRAAILYEIRNAVMVTFADAMFNLFKETKLVLTGNIAMDIRNTGIFEDGVRIVHEKLKELKEKDTKIFFAEVQPYTALVLFCEVYKLGLYGPDIVWIINSISKRFDNWLGFNSSRYGQIISCSKSQIKEAVQGAFTFPRQVLRDDSVRTASGLTAQEYLDKLVDMANGTFLNIKKTSLTSSVFSFDAVWAVATALNNSIEPLKRIDLDLVPGQCEKEILKQLKKVNFEGIGGPFSYSQHSITRDGTITISQFNEMSGKFSRVGYHNTKGDPALVFINGSKSLWSNGESPKDHSTVITKYLEIQPKLIIAISTIAAIGILLGILFLMFNLIYGKYKFIKLSAPLFNNIIALGCILCLVSVFLFGVHKIDNPKTSFPLICKARAWTLTIGFSCAFGAMFVKTWRIYKICTNKKLQVKLGPLSDWYLLSLVGGIIILDLVILITWELVDPIRHKEHVVNRKRKDPDISDTFFKDVVNMCYAEQMTVWLTIIYVTKGIVILYGLFLAYETRNVIYAHLNDSRVIGICVYNVVVLSIVGVFLSILLDDKNFSEMYIVLSVCIIFPAVATICLIMFPKVAYRCKTNNLDDTETIRTIGNGMATVQGSFDASNTGRPAHVTTHVPLQNNTLRPTSNQDAKFSYQNGVSESSVGLPDTVSNHDT